jgi:hypothetical protein
VKRGFVVGIAVFFTLLGAVAISLMSCGGGGEGAGESSSTGSLQSGSVAVLLADNPADDYKSIFLTITEVSLIPAGNNGAPVVIFQSAGGLEVDLLEYRDEDFLLTLKKQLPAALYAKIRLIVKDIQVEPQPGAAPPCANLEIKLPSGRIDLEPREPFRVTPGGMLAIRLDIDANKSINLHQAGNSGKCIFRPVVFVDIQEGMGAARCPKVLSGTIGRLIKNDQQVVGFALDLPDDRGTIEVSIPGDGTVINNLGLCALPKDLSVGDQVKVRGKLGSSGVFEASLVVVGPLLDVTGTASTVPTFSGSTFTFNFIPAPNQGLVGPGPWPVQGRDCTLTLRGCDTIVDPAGIQAGMTVRVFGKVVSEIGENGQTTAIFRAAAIILKEREIVGQIASIEPTTGGMSATIQPNDGSLVAVFIPDGAPISLQGDGAVPPGLLCIGQQVSVLLKAGTLSAEAALVTVQSQRHEGTVGSIGPVPRTLTVNLTGDGTETVLVEDGATILNSIGDGQSQVPFDDIKVGSPVVYFGLAGCGTDTQFHAFIVVIGESD